MVDRLMKVTYSGTRRNGARINVEASMPSTELDEWLVHVEEEVQPWDYVTDLETQEPEGTAPQGEAATQ